MKLKFHMEDNNKMVILIHNEMCCCISHSSDVCVWWEVVGWVAGSAEVLALIRTYETDAVMYVSVSLC